MIGMGVTLSGSIAGIIGYFKNLDWSGATAADVDVTNLNSPDNFQQFEAGLKNAGVLSGNLQFNAALWETVIEALGESQTWTLTFTDDASSQLIATGYINQVGAAMPMGDELTMPIQLKFSGRVFFPSSSSSSSSSSS